jgi:hypothetical protein
MSAGAKVKATAAPKNPAQAVFAVTNGATKKPLKGAHVKIQGTSDEGSAVLIEGDTDAKGRFSKIFEAGTYDTTVTLDAFGPAPCITQWFEGTCVPSRALCWA